MMTTRFVFNETNTRLQETVQYLELAGWTRDLSTFAALYYCGAWSVERLRANLRRELAERIIRDR